MFVVTKTLLTQDTGHIDSQKLLLAHAACTYLFVTGTDFTLYKTKYGDIEV